MSALRPGARWTVRRGSHFLVTAAASAPRAPWLQGQRSHGPLPSVVPWRPTPRTYARVCPSLTAPRGLAYLSPRAHFCLSGR